MIKGLVTAAALGLALAVIPLPASAGSETAITMTQPQLRLMRTLLMQDLEVYMHGGKSLFKWGLLGTVTAKNSISNASLNRLHSSRGFPSIELFVKAIDISLPDSNPCKKMQYRGCTPDLQSTMHNQKFTAVLRSSANKYGVKLPEKLRMRKDSRPSHQISSEAGNNHESSEARQLHAQAYTLPVQPHAYPFPHQKVSRDLICGDSYLLCTYRQLWAAVGRARLRWALTPASIEGACKDQHILVDLNACVIANTLKWERHRPSSMEAYAEMWLPGASATAAAEDDNPFPN